ncbi:MAG TPA: toll/interleukin-1 receptor domain-containing protein, partial [Alphaproteobacteria bacterium]|nr:toll/interleukin-1 receptor domain-containing protein [Alphaproteobacteria bacterium]
MADLFISYARNDAPQIEALAAILERAGWSVWWDRRITTGSSFDLVIEQALAEAKAVIVAWSRHSVGSEWVRAEAAFAIEKKKLVPVRLDETIPPLRFTNVQTVDLSGWDKTGASAPFRRLIADLSQLIGLPPEAGAATLGPAPSEAAAGVATGPSRQPQPAPPAKPARRVGALVMGLAALLLVAGVGAVLALRGGSDHPAQKAAEVQ